jgi:hypothetical protein
MTSKERESHITTIENLLTKYGATKDRFGMFHIGTRKFDTRKNNLKIYNNNIKVQSVVLTKVNLAVFANYLHKIQLEQQQH